MDTSRHDLSTINKNLKFFTREFIVYYYIIPMEGAKRKEVTNFINNSLNFANAYKYLKRLEEEGYIFFEGGTTLKITRQKHNPLRAIFIGFPDRPNEKEYEESLNTEISNIFIRKNYINFIKEVKILLGNVEKRIKSKENPTLIQNFIEIKRAFSAELVLRSFDLSLQLK